MTYIDPIAPRNSVGFKYPLSLTSEMSDDLIRVAAEESSSKAVVIRTALYEYIERHDANKRKPSAAVKTVERKLIPGKAAVLPDNY